MRIVLILALLLVTACSDEREVSGDPLPNPDPIPDPITEEFSLLQLSPPFDSHGSVRWPEEEDAIRFTYRIVPARTGIPSAWHVSDEHRVRGVILIPPQSDGRGRLSPLTGTTILGERLLSPAGWTASRETWMGGEVIHFRSEVGHLPAEGAEFGIELAKGEGWPSAFGSVYTCAVALTGDGRLPTASGGGPARLHNLVGPAADSNVVWWWFRCEREQPSDGISDPPPISLPIGEKR